MSGIARSRSKVSAQTGRGDESAYELHFAGFLQDAGSPGLGRDFSETRREGCAEGRGGESEFAKTLSSESNPIGQSHRLRGAIRGPRSDITIVGVVGDTKYEDLREEIPIEVYLPYTQAGVRDGDDRVCPDVAGRQSMRSRRCGAWCECGCESADVRDADAEEQVDKSLVTERLVASLASAFGVLATLLAAIGLYGVMAYTVARRTREIGIRMALGATTGDVVWLVMREVLILLVIGLGVGFPAALGLTRFVQAQLYGMQPADAATMAMAVVVGSRWWRLWRAICRGGVRRGLIRCRRCVGSEG